MQITCEKWKPVKGYEGFYSVSNCGRVKSLERTASGTNRRQSEKILTPVLGNRGYYSVNLCKNGKQRRFYIHRLVAYAFIPNPSHFLYVNHKDEDTENNRADNLEWCTREYNYYYGTATERRGLSHNKAVRQINEGGEMVRCFRNASQVAEFGFSPDAVKKCCQGRQKMHGGYFWRYSE